MGMFTDLQRVKAGLDLVALAGVSLKPSGRYHIGPCPFCGGKDRFTVKHTDEGDLWHCRHCSSGKYQDGIAFVMKREGLDLAGALNALGQGVITMGTTKQEPGTRPQPIEQPPDEDWQTAALLACEQAARYLQEARPDAAAVRDYLQKQRGLTPDTIWQQMIGYNPAWLQVDGGNWLAPGITIPAMMGGDLWYVQVRTTAKARAEAEQRGRNLDKYHALTGSRLKALFRADTLLQAETAVVTEGEFDALLLGQVAPAGAAVVTMGSAGTLPGVAFLKYFAPIRRLFLAMDNDGAGAKGLAEWQALIGWAELMPPLADGAKDVTDYWRAGGDVRAWLQKGIEA